MNAKKTTEPEQAVDLDDIIDRVKAAQRKFATFSQEKVDKIFKEMAIKASNARIPLAKMAVKETGMGVIEDKVIKNHFAAEYIFNQYKNVKTCGVIEEDVSFGIKKVAEPFGVIAGIIPTTNPTSTVIFKTMLALKTRNAIIFSPHPRAKKCTCATAKLMLDAAVEAGAPQDIIGWIDEPAIVLTQQLMQHPKVNLILATGGGAMVKAAYCSGTPALGVGAGNTPVVVDETADVQMAVSSILISKTFDNGLICSSEQSVIVVEEKYEDILREFKLRGGHFLGAEDKKKLEATLFKDGKLNIDIIGQTAFRIAEIAGITVPPHTKALLCEVKKIGKEEPLSLEKLSPILAVYRATDYKAAAGTAMKLLGVAGMGHTSVYYTAATNQDRITYFGEKLKTSRVLVNMPSSQGAIGDLYNFRLAPSLTLGCGSWGGNAVSENIGVKHLLNLKTVAERRENMLWFKVPSKVYFKYGCLPVALEDLRHKKRAFIVTDQPLFDLHYPDKVAAILKNLGIECEVFHDVEPNPSLQTVYKGLVLMNGFKPDIIIGLGGGSPIDAAKVMWLMYESPDEKFEDLALRFMDIRKRVCAFPELGRKSLLVAIPTTSGTGTEVTPFSVITDGKTGEKWPIADYALTPDMAIIDPELVLSMPKSLTAFSGLDAVTHALESYVSTMATEYTQSLSLEALRLLFRYLPVSYREGANNPEAREKVHYAATIAGMAFANAFLGVCHSMAHKLGGTFHLAHGLANALLISHVIRYNAVDVPVKQAAFSQYKYPCAKRRYSEIADHLNLGGKTPDEKVDKLIAAIEMLKEDVDCPASIADAGIVEKDFMDAVGSVADQAFDDQCTGANPRYPLISEIKELLIKAYHGKE